MPVRPGVAQIVPATQSNHVEVNELLVQIGRLPADQREVLVLAAVEELRYQEIASLLGVPVGTVISPLGRTWERLRRMVEAPPSRLQAIK